MIDDLREQASLDFETPGEQDLQQAPPGRWGWLASGGRILGLSAAQRFLLALLLFLMVVTASAGCLLLTGRIYP